MDASLLLGAEICSGVGGGLILIALILFGLRLPYFMER